jgi:hypothetical protein
MYRLVTKHQLMYNIHYKLLIVLVSQLLMNINNDLTKHSTQLCRLHKLPTIDKTLKSIDNMVD